MLTALYIGDHARDSLPVRLGCWATQVTQRGDFKRVTHVEAILVEEADGRVTIGSASLRDGSCVRVKSRVLLDPANWMIVEVPAWQAQRAQLWFAEHAGQRYDLRGALATVLPGRGRQNHWFCNQAVGAAVGLQQPHIFGPGEFAAIATSFGRDVTTDFFQARAA